MLKLMLKKELGSMVNSLLRRNSDRRNISKRNTIVYICLFTFLFLTLSISFGGTAYLFCRPLCEANLTWMYFAIMGLTALMFGVLGSVFSAYYTLYKAKDNEFLLSLPINKRDIILSRIFSIYIMALVFQLLILIPIDIIYFVEMGFNILILISSLVIFLILPLLSTVISSILGWLLALLTRLIKNNQIFITILLIALLFGYFALTMNITDESVITDIMSLEKTFKNTFVLYSFGLAFSGNFLHLLGFVLVTISIFGCTYYILSKSFYGLISYNDSLKKVYKRQEIRSAKPLNALVRKELKRFFSSSNYMINCGLGSVFLVILSVMLFIYRETILGVINQVEELNRYLPILLVIAPGIVSSMNYITAPSISLEGRSIWIYKSIPVSAKDIFKAKIIIHIIISIIPVLLFIFCFLFVINPHYIYWIMLPIISVLFLVVCAMFGLFANLLFPNLTWNNETYPIKQGISILMALFIPWVLLIALAGLGILIMDIVKDLFLLIIMLIYIGIIIGLHLFLSNKGVKIFDSL